MGWGSFDDQFHKQLHWDTVSGDAYRLYCGLVGEACALRKWDGVLPRMSAMCAVPGLVMRFEELLKELLTIDGLIEDHGSGIEILTICDHIPPPGQRPGVLEPRKKRNRDDHWRRKCDKGEHGTHCPPSTCPVKARKPRRGPVRGPVSEPVPEMVADEVTGELLNASDQWGEPPIEHEDNWQPHRYTPNGGLRDRSPRDGSGRVGEVTSTDKVSLEEKASAQEPPGWEVEDPPENDRDVR